VNDIQVVRYGPAEDQYAELWSPAGSGTAPVVALIHGGYWRTRYRCDLMRPLAADLCSRGYVVWNLEYRRVGVDGGGWPGTFLDVAAGLDALDRALHSGGSARPLALVGHSAGGQLALWACGRRRPAEPSRGTPSLVVSLAGVTDLIAGARLQLSDGAVRELLGGGPDEVPERYRLSCPMHLLPLGVPQLMVHGTADADVPYEFAPRYAAAACAAGDRAELLTLPGVDHFALIDPASAAWAAVADHLSGWSSRR
jgi:acetyl esterase/lipase